jgi:hypothetical protein
MNFHEHFDKIYYINLKHRTDRNTHMVNLLKNLDVPKNKIERIEAFRTPKFGALGCAKSHLKAQLDAVRNNYNRVLILEDDFYFFDNQDATAKLTKFITENNDWDVLMFTAQTLNREESGIENVDRIIEAFTASAYLINGHDYIKKLANNYRESVDWLQSLTSPPEFCHKCSDVHWRELQKVDKWYCFNPVLGKQLVNHSDTAGCVIDREEEKYQ